VVQGVVPGVRLCPKDQPQHVPSRSGAGKTLLRPERTRPGRSNVRPFNRRWERVPSLPLQSYALRLVPLGAGHSRAPLRWVRFWMRPLFQPCIPMVLLDFLT
jgi:hypothetical protein